VPSMRSCKVGLDNFQFGVDFLEGEKIALTSMCREVKKLLLF
jgi:hypothetical protein